MNSDLATLMQMSRPELASAWEQLFGCPPPFKCGTEFIRQVLGWQCQADHLGKLSGFDRRRLKQSANGQRHQPSKPAPGTRLIRLWQGRNHQVMVLDVGYSYDGKYWKSLSAIARAITGTPWSGPAFFGLKSGKSDRQ
jgi:hypothetical protein